jgi:hypothetical protein
MMETIPSRNKLKFLHQCETISKTGSVAQFNKFLKQYENKALNFYSDVGRK